MAVPLFRDMRYIVSLAKPHRTATAAATKPTPASAVFSPTAPAVAASPNTISPPVAATVDVPAVQLQAPATPIATDDNNIRVGMQPWEVATRYGVSPEEFEAVEASAVDPSGLPPVDEVEHVLTVSGLLTSHPSLPPF